jgi:hypothetical protein
MRKILFVALAIAALTLAGCAWLDDWFNGPATYSVSYDANGGSGAPADAAVYAAGDEAIVKAPGAMAKTECAFAGWNTEADGGGSAYDPSDPITVNGNVVLYAQWTDLIWGTWAGTPLDLTPFGAAGYWAEDTLTILDDGTYAISRAITDGTSVIPYAILHAGFGGAEAGLGIIDANPQEIESGTYDRLPTAESLFGGYTGYYNRTATATTIPTTPAHVAYQSKFSTASVANDTLTVHDGGGTSEHGVMTFTRQ